MIARSWRQQEIEALAQALARLPGLGPRSARRAVLHLMKRRESALEPLLAALQNVAEQPVDLLDLRQCRHQPTRAPSAATRAATTRCCAWSRRSPTCGRSIARACFPGRYHVLGGRLSALDGVRPEDLGIDSLVARVAAGGIDEVVLAMNATLEGPDHRPLSRRAAREISRSASASWRTACRSAANSIISTKARWRRRCARGARSLEPRLHLTND